MKKVISLQQVQTVINAKGNFYHEIAGKKYDLNVVRLLGMTMLEVINMINDGVLFFDLE